VQAEDMARAVLAWNRHGVCPECNGHGYQVIPGSPSLSDTECKACLGTGKVLLHKQFRKDHQDAALWMQGQIEAVQATAGQAAMRCLAPSLEL
jgi:DnaJ-class molecular chaperone